MTDGHATPNDQSSTATPHDLPEPENKIRGLVIYPDNDRQSLQCDFGSEPSDIKRAASCAQSIFRQAVSIATNYRQDRVWFDSDMLVVPASQFGQLLRDARYAALQVNAVAKQFIKAKRDSQPIRFGRISGSTAHQVATLFADKVADAISWNLLAGEPRALIRWPADGLMTEHHEQLFCRNWQLIRDALAKIELGNGMEMMAILRIEEQFAIELEIPADNRTSPLNAVMNTAPSTKTDRAKTSKEETNKRVMAAIAYKVQNLEWAESKCAREAGLPATTLNGHKLWKEWKLTIESAQRNGNIQKVKREFDKRINEFVVVDGDSE